MYKAAYKRGNVPAFPFFAVNMAVKNFTEVSADFYVNNVIP